MPRLVGACSPREPGWDDHYETIVSYLWLRLGVFSGHTPCNRTPAMSKSKPSFRPIVFDKKSVELFKQEARKLKRSIPLTHTQAIDLVVQKHGFRNWNHFIELRKRMTTPVPVPFGLCFREPPSTTPCPLAKPDPVYCKNSLVDIGKK